MKYLTVPHEVPNSDPTVPPLPHYQLAAAAEALVRARGSGSAAATEEEMRRLRNKQAKVSADGGGKKRSKIKAKRSAGRSKAATGRPALRELLQSAGQVVVAEHGHDEQRGQRRGNAVVHHRLEAL